MKFFRAILISVTTILILSSPVMAINQAQLDLFNSGVTYFEAQVRASSSDICGEDSVLAGSGNEEKIFNFFVAEKGLSAPQSAGIVGNIMHESSGDPQNIQNPAGRTQDPTPLTGKTQGWGLIQWTPGNRVIEMAKTAGVTGPIYELSSQLELIWQNMNNNPVVTQPFDLNYYKTITDAKTAADYFEEKIEGAGIVAAGDREAKAVSALQRFGSGSSSVTADSGNTACTGSSGEVVGNFSLPVSKTIYTQNPGWFTKPHHDYPAADIPIPANTPVYSITDGTVLALNDPDCGKGVMIDAGGGIIYLYCHGMDGGSIVKAGAQVKAGQLIMHSGYTGHVDPPGPAGAHLHVQITINGQNHCPQNLLVGIANGNIPDVKSLPTSGCFY